MPTVHGQTADIVLAHLMAADPELAEALLRTACTQAMEPHATGQPAVADAADVLAAARLLLQHRCDAVHVHVPAVLVLVHAVLMHASAMLVHVRTGIVHVHAVLCWCMDLLCHAPVGVHVCERMLHGHAHACVRAYAA
eukprot:350868-Chlamydomonas_euryale.AAC.10